MNLNSEIFIQKNRLFWRDSGTQNIKKSKCINLQWMLSACFGYWEAQWCIGYHQKKWNRRAKFAHWSSVFFLICLTYSKVNTENNLCKHISGSSVSEINFQFSASIHSLKTSNIKSSPHIWNVIVIWGFIFPRIQLSNSHTHIYIYIYIYIYIW